jgi:hypothetical protein
MPGVRSPPCLLPEFYPYYSKPPVLAAICSQPNRDFFDSWFQYPFVVLVTSAIWITVTYMTPAEDKSVLRTFYQKIQPGGPGWKKVIDEATAEQVNITDDSQGWSVPFGNYCHVVGLWNDLWRHVLNRLLDLWSKYPSFYYHFYCHCLWNSFGSYLEKCKG